VAVCGNQSKNNKMLILNEAFRLNLMPSLSEFKAGKWTIEQLEQRIRVIFFNDFINLIFCLKNFVLRKQKNQAAIKI